MTTEKPSEATRLRQELAECRLEVERLGKRLQEEVGILNHLIRVSTVLNSTLNLSELLRLIMNSAKELLNAEACSVLLVDEDTNELAFEVALGEKGAEITKQRIPGGQGIAGHVARTGEHLIVNSVRDHPQFDDRFDRAIGFETRNILAVPLKAKDRIVGVVEIINTQGREGFNQKDLPLAIALSNQAAVAIDNARLYRNLADALVMARMSYRL